MKIRESSAWSAVQIEEFLNESVLPIRLGCIGEEGTPLVVSLWYLFEHNRLWCALHESAATLRYLRETPRCGFEIAADGPPYSGVRGQARVSIDQSLGATKLDELLVRYGIKPDTRLARFLNSRREEEYAVALDPIWISAWDYRERMQT